MADNLILSNDALGYEFYEETIEFPTCVPLPLNDASALAFSTSAAPAPVRVMNRPGRIIDFGFGVVNPAVSASGFVSGTIDATLTINGVGSVLSQLPTVKMYGSAGQLSGALSGRVFVNASAASTAFQIPAVINQASAQFNAGDQLGVQVNARSVGSAAAGTAGAGFYGYVKVRYSAQ